MTTKTVSTVVAAATTATSEIIRLKDGCPNCGVRWTGPKPDPGCTIWFQEPKKPRAGLELCSDCFCNPHRRIKKTRITTIISGLGRNSNRDPKWSRPKRRAFEIALEKFLGCS